MVAEWDCIVRNLVRVADGRVKPSHDGVGERRFQWRLALRLIQPGTTLAEKRNGFGSELKG